MVSRACWASLTLLAVGALTLAARPAAVAPEIKDDGKFFSAEAVTKANVHLRDLTAKYDRDVLIETFATPPGEGGGQVKELDAKGREAFFEKYALQRAKFRVVRGVYVLVCKEPRFLFIEVSPQTRKVITDDVRKQLFGVFAKEFAKGRFDEGLENGLRFIEERFAKAK